ncbi:MAG: hypothetical protein ACJA1L_001590 [Paracoccaceae bacterium]|jgi:hypothetical protein
MDPGAIGPIGRSAAPVGAIPPAAQGPRAEKGRGIAAMADQAARRLRPISPTPAMPVSGGSPAAGTGAAAGVAVSPDRNPSSPS